MITKIGINNFQVRNFGLNFKGNKVQRNHPANLGKDTFTFKGFERVGKIGAEVFPQKPELSQLVEIRNKANAVVKEVCGLYKKGEFNTDEGAGVQIINLSYNGSETMFEHSAGAEIVRKSKFKDGKLQETRMPIKGSDGTEKSIIIKLYEDGKTVKAFEIKRGDKSGEGTIESMITFDRDGRIVSFMG